MPLALLLGSITAIVVGQMLYTYFKSLRSSEAVKHIELIFVPLQMINLGLRAYRVHSCSFEGHP